MQAIHSPVYREDVLFEGVDWPRVCLPPCVDAVIDRIEASGSHADRRHAEVVRAYYAPGVSVSAESHGPGRGLRVAHQQIVVVGRDGTVLATWRDREDRYGTGVTVPAPRTPLAPPGKAPSAYVELLALLDEQAIPVSRHPWGDHHRVHTPSGRDVFLPVEQVPDDDVAVDADLLRRCGVCLLQNKAVD